MLNSSEKTPTITWTPLRWRDRESSGKWEDRLGDERPKETVPFWKVRAVKNAESAWRISTVSHLRRIPEIPEQSRNTHTDSEPIEEKF